MARVSYHDKTRMATKLEDLYGMEFVRDLYQKGLLRIENIEDTFERLGGGTGMPIEGLSDRTLLPRIGKIHLGIKHATKGYPIATDYFVFPADHPQYQDLVDTFGEKPNVLQIVFPVADEEQVASQYYRQYSQSRGLVCKGDGLKCNMVVDAKTGKKATAETKETEWAEHPCGGRACPDYGAKKCKEVMNLQFMLPQIPGLGVWQIDTSSINSIINVNSQFALIRSVYGTIGMVPVILSLEPKEVKSPDDGKLKTVRVLHIRSGDTLLEAAQKAMMEPLERLTGRKRLVLISGGDVEAPEILVDDDQPDSSEQVRKDISDLWEKPAGEQTEELPFAGPEEGPTGKGTPDETPLTQAQLDGGTEEPPEASPKPKRTAKKATTPEVKSQDQPCSEEQQDAIKNALKAAGMAMPDIDKQFNGVREWGVANLRDLTTLRAQIVLDWIATRVGDKEAAEKEAAE